MITASMIHDVYTKMSKKSESQPLRLINRCLGKSKFLGNHSTRYGHANEEKAAQTYFKIKSVEHRNLRIEKCGLTVLQEHSYIGIYFIGYFICHIQYSILELCMIHRYYLRIRETFFL